MSDPYHDFRNEMDGDFAKQLAWLGAASADQIRRRAEDELHDAGRRTQRILMGLLIVAFLAYVLWWQTANAGTVPLTCTAPTQNTDGSAISATLAYKAYWGTSATTLPNAVTLAGPGCKGSVVVPDAPAGGQVTYHFAVTAIANGMESAKSNQLARTFSTPFPTPKPPVLLTTEQVGYQQNLGRHNLITLSRVASVPLGKPCTEFKLTDPFRTVHILADRLWAVMDPNPKKPGEFFTRPNQVWVRCEPS